LIVATILSAVSPGAAAEPPRQPVFSSETALVSLPVFVADRQGRAMRGLTAEDFELLEDGKPAPVVAFQYVDTTSPEEQTQILQVPAARRHFLLLFDLSFTSPAGVHRAREAARAMLKNLAESDLAAVGTVDVNRGVRIVANFTEDRALLAHAVDTLGVVGPTRIGDPLSLSVEMTSPDLQTLRAGGRLSESGASDVAAQVAAVILRLMRSADENLYRRQVSTLIGSLDELAKGLRGVEGRKQILYFSAGFDSQTLVGLSGADAVSASMASIEGRIQDIDSQARYGDTLLRNVFSAMTRNLSSSDCVVHSVDVTGLGVDKSLTQTAPREDLARDTSGRESLHFMANETGGRFFKDTNNLSEILGEVLDMTSRYYILGYQPRELKGPGRFHKVKVRVRRKDAHVSHRAGYFERVARAAQTPLQRKFEAAQLVMTGAGASGVPFSALCLPFPAAGERQTLGVVMQVPRQALRWTGRMAVEVYGYAVAADGTVLDHLAQLAQIDPAQADRTGAAQGVSFYTTLQVPPGKYTIKLMVQEPETGAAGAQFIDVTVPPYEAHLGFLLPPIVMDDATRWLGLDLGGSRGGRAASPFAVDGEPFLPRTSFRIKNGEEEKLVLIAYAPNRPSDPAAGIEITSSLTDSRGALVATGPIRIVKVHRDEDGRRTYVLGYTPQGLAPGDYTMRIGIGESGARLESYALLRVREETRTAAAH
jgi:VWFA-related protein